MVTGEGVFDESVEGVRFTNVVLITVVREGVDGRDDGVGDTAVFRNCTAAMPAKVVVIVFNTDADVGTLVAAVLPVMFLAVFALLGAISVFVAVEAMSVVTPPFIVGVDAFVTGVIAVDVNPHSTRECLRLAAFVVVIVILFCKSIFLSLLLVLSLLLLL